MLLADELPLSAAESRLLEAAREFSRREVGPNAARWEPERIYPRETIRAAAARPDTDSGSGTGGSRLALSRQGPHRRGDRARHITQTAAPKYRMNGSRLAWSAAATIDATQGKIFSPVRNFERFNIKYAF
jgi:hypothetical protein